MFWQCRRRLTNRPLNYQYVNGMRLLARQGWPVSTGTYYFGLLEFEPQAFLTHLLQPEDLFVDAGAHIGTYALSVASKGTRVIAVEPNPEASAYLAEHLALNGDEGHVELYQLALSDTSGQIMLTRDKGQQNHIVRASEENAIPVEARTLDDLCQGRAPTAMKIDVEGYELAVLRGAGQALGDASLLAVCVETMGLAERYGHSDHQVLEYLGSYGFEPVTYQPESRSLLPGGRASMQIMIRDRERVQERLTRAEDLQFCGKYRL
ncbi:MAG: FkbM family methyltransferase [Saprospiraceae bacterium]|nr:FkbM family methyltransferase [Saprospiraceae bacterium]